MVHFARVSLLWGLTGFRQVRGVKGLSRLWLVVRKQIPPLCCGMTIKKAGNCNDNDNNNCNSNNNNNNNNNNNIAILMFLGLASTT